MTVVEKSVLGPPYWLVLDCVSPWMLQGDVEKAVEVFLNNKSQLGFVLLSCPSLTFIINRQPVNKL